MATGPNQVRNQVMILWKDSDMIYYIGRIFGWRRHVIRDSGNYRKNTIPRGFHRVIKGAGLFCEGAQIFSENLTMISEAFQSFASMAQCCSWKFS